MMNMGIQDNQMLMQKLMQLRGGGRGGNMPQGSPLMPQGGGNPNPPMPQMPQYGGNMGAGNSGGNMGQMPTQNPANPMGGGLQSMAPQDPMLARKLMMMKLQGGQGQMGINPGSDMGRAGGNMGTSYTGNMGSGGGNSDGMTLNRMG